MVDVRIVRLFGAALQLHVKRIQDLNLVRVCQCYWGIPGICRLQILKGPRLTPPSLKNEDPQTTYKVCVNVTDCHHHHHHYDYYCLFLNIADYHHLELLSIKLWIVMIRIPSLPGFSHPQSIIGAPRDGSNHPRLRENDHIPCDKFTAWVCSMATDPNEFLVNPTIWWWYMGYI